MGLDPNLKAPFGWATDLLLANYYLLVNVLFFFLYKEIQFIMSIYEFK